MKIKDLIKNINILKRVNFNEKTLDIDVKNICDNTKSKLKNSVFVCINGFNFDSHKISSNFKDLGIKFVVAEKEIDTSLPYVIVNSTREVLGTLCDNFFCNPTKSFKLIGVIGTNGKTSTTYFIKQILELNKKKCCVIGTSGVFVNKKRLKETLTTPDPILLYSLFDLARKNKSDYVVMEISAHAIKLKKVANLVCDIVCFTNFSQDHLDFFKTMENYKQTKLSFFNEYNTKKAIINADDKVGIEICEKLKNNFKTFAIDSDADFKADNIELSLSQSQFDLKINNCAEKVKVNVPCLFNVYNILCAVSVCKELGLEISPNLLQNLKPNKGRFDVFCLKNNRFIVIDYAHTPESLKIVLESVRKLQKNCKIIALFGCPGNRDETKRELMGQIASKFCNKIYITTDNPKFENPLIICEEIKRGTKDKGIVVESRKQAIKVAIKNLKENQVLCLIGKGTEDYQDINNKKIKYSDYTVALKCIKKLKKQ